MGKIYVVIGKSATGKDTIYKKLIQDTDLSLQTIVSYTTRPIRSQETEGIEYHFVSDQELLKIQESGRVIELRTYHTVHGDWHYFTVNDGQFDNPDHRYILIGTLQQYEKIRDYFGEDKVAPVYIEVDAKERLLRSITRESLQECPNYSEVCRRFLADEGDFSEEEIQRLKITKRYVNEDLSQCFEQIKSDLLS